MSAPHVAAVLPPLALLWEQPWLLFWGAGAALPLLIHLLSRRRYQTTPWAAMDFLLAAARRQSRRIRLENWLLLVLRTLIILLFVVAAAGPYREASESIAPPQQRVHTIFVLDGSFSMGQSAAGETLFDAAKDAIVRQIERDERRDDAFSLVMMAAPARAIVRTPSTDRQAFADAVGALELPHGRADLPGALALIRDMVTSAPKAWPPLVRQEVVFLTDLGRNTWGRTSGSIGVRDDAILAQFDALAAEADLRIVELGSRSASNVAIARLALDDSLALPNVENTVFATVRNCSDIPRSDIAVELLVDGRRVAQQGVRELAARGDATVAFSYRFATAGQQTLEARIAPPGDALDIDNRRWLVVEVRDRLHTLCVSGKPGSADFISIAVAPKEAAGASFESNVVSPALLRSGLALDDYDAVVLCNVPSLGVEELRRVSDFVRRGGGLIWFLGDMVEASAYNAMTSGDLAGLLPASVVRPSPWGAYTIDPMDFSHAILDPFRGQQDATLVRTPIQRYFQLATTDDATQTFMRIAETGDSLAVERRFGKGRVLAFATDGSLASIDSTTKEPWTYWPVWQSFLPVVQESLRFVVGGRSDSRNVSVGMSLGGTIPGASRDAEIVVQSPSAIAEQIASIVAESDGRRRWEFVDTTTSGVYRVESRRSSGSPTESAEAFAVNLDSAESDLTRATRDELPDSVSVVAGELDSTPEGAVVTTARDDWHVALLCGLLALVVAETACAWLLGRRMA